MLRVLDCIDVQHDLRLVALAVIICLLACFTALSLLARSLLFAGGAVLLFVYGLSLNLAPLAFGRVVGLYIALLFVVWQIINFVVFRSLPTLPILLGGALIIAGGGIVTFWQR